MNCRALAVTLPFAALLVVLCSNAFAQQVRTTVPLVNSSDSFYESFGTDWGFSRSGPKGYMFFNRGGANTGIPPFGGYDPSAVARFGFGSRGNGWSSYFNAWAGQGSNRSITSAAPSVTLQNGTSGYFQDATIRPFVTGFVPVVGDRSIAPLRLDVVEERMERLRQEATAASQQSNASSLVLGSKNEPSSVVSSSSASARSPSTSSAERGDISLAEIKRQQTARPEVNVDDEINELIEAAQLAEASGSIGAARLRYRKAAAKATGELKQALLSKIESLGD